MGREYSPVVFEMSTDLCCSSRYRLNSVELARSTFGIDVRELSILQIENCVLRQTRSGDRANAFLSLVPRMYRWVTASEYTTVYCLVVQYERRGSPPLKSMLYNAHVQGETLE